MFDRWLNQLTDKHWATFEVVSFVVWLLVALILCLSAAIAGTLEWLIPTSVVLIVAGFIIWTVGGLTVIIRTSDWIERRVVQNRHHFPSPTQ